jgi:hypothetical protein
MTGGSLTGVEIMLAELESSCLEVALVPCRRFVNEGGCIRVAVQKNTRWYRDFCARHLSSRRRQNALPDTKIKRRDTIRVLEAIIAGKARSKYVPDLLRIAARYKERRAVA